MFIIRLRRPLRDDILLVGDGLALALCQLSEAAPLQLKRPIEMFKGFRRGGRLRCTIGGVDPVFDEPLHIQSFGHRPISDIRNGPGGSLGPIRRPRSRPGPPWRSWKPWNS